MNKSDILIKLSDEAAVIANNDDRLPYIALMGDIFTSSHSTSTIAIDYNQSDISYSWMAAKGRAQRQHTVRPYGRNRQIRSIDSVFETLDSVAYDSIYAAVEDNLKSSQTTDAPLLSLILDQLRNA